MAKEKRGLKRCWKPVTLEGKLTGEEWAQLAGMEELTNYQVITQKQGEKVLGRRHKAGERRPLHSTKKKQRRINLSEDEPAAKKKKVEANMEVVPKRKRKKRIKICKTPKDTNAESKLSSQDLDIPMLDGYQRVEGWNGLIVPEPVLRSLSDLGFSTPTPIQALTLPSAIRDRMDILGAAETGSGKTLAFGIPIIHHILEDKAKEVQGNGYKPLRALVLTPTRELAIQVKKHLHAAAKYTDIKVASVVGGMALQKQQRILRRCPDIVVATPGRLWELIDEGDEHLFKVPNVKYLVVDEADRMVEKGHFAELLQILGLMNSNEHMKRNRQNFVFSATLTMIHATPKRLLTKKRKLKMTSKQKLENLMELIGMSEKPKIIDITRKVGTAEMLTEARISCSLEDKDVYLYYFLKKYPGRTLVFCNSIDCIRRLRTVLELLQCTPLPLHASMHQRQRLKNLDRFAEREAGLLLATDVAARGLDIPGVQHVVHYQVPRTAEVYVHRSGRTARAQREGLSLTLISPQEIPQYRQLCKTLNRDEDLTPFPVDHSLLRLIRARVSVAVHLDKAIHSHKRKTAQNRWFTKAAEEMDVELDEDILTDIGNMAAQASHRRQIQTLQKQLDHLLQIPLIPQGLAGSYPTKSGKLLLPLPQGVESAIVGVKKERKLYASGL